MSTSADTQQTEQLAELQSVADRTRTIEVTTRIVAIDGDNITEVEKNEKVFIRPLPMRRWLTALGIMSGLLANMPEGEFDLENETHLGLWIVELLGNIPDDIIAIACLATDKKPEFFDQIDLDEGVKIILAVVEINKDFFVRKVLPMLLEQAPKIKTAMKETFGQTA